MIRSERLPVALRDVIEEAPDRCWFSPISVWEIGKLQEKGRIGIEGDLRSWLSRSLDAMPLKQAPLNTEVALTSLELKLQDPDPADRFLAATALVFELTLVTVDRRLTSADWLPTLSS
ncbi:MAG: type II toxin-antitoxin system VapC family toxin [Thermoanaerobaculia bacterium]